MVRGTEHVARTGGKRNAYGFLVGKPEGYIALGRYKCRCDDNIGMDLEDINLEGTGWTNLPGTGTSSKLFCAR